MSLLSKLDKQIKSEYIETPYRFFSEHDIHTELARKIMTIFEQEQTLWEITADGKKITRVHHEYPTPFRCDMKGTRFKKYSEKEYDKKKKLNPSLRVGRGHFDLVVFNREYIRNNDFKNITGKDYRSFLNSINEEQPTALDLAIEVVYYISLDTKPHSGIMLKRMRSTDQDYKKLIALMGFNLKYNIPFCKESAMMFFSNTPHNDEMKDNIGQIRRSDKVQLLSYYSS